MTLVDTTRKCSKCGGNIIPFRAPICTCPLEAGESADPKKEERQYRVTYNGKAHPDGIAKKDIPEGAGACDCLFIASILGQPGGPGPLDVQFASLNGFKGDGEPLEPMQEFNIFGMFAHYLAETLPEGSDPQKVCQETFEKIQSLVLNWRAATLGDAIVLVDKIRKGYDGSSS